MKTHISGWKKTLRNPQGFTLVELAVVIVIIGVLAAFGVPKFRNAVERSKAAEAFNYCDAIRSAQERYHSREGIYSVVLNNLDIYLTTPKYFAVGTPTINSGADTWIMQLTRSGASAGYGSYTVAFNQDGFVGGSSNSNIPDVVSPLSTNS